MKTIYETMHDGVVGRVVEPDEIDPDQPYAEQLQVMIGFDPEAPRLSTEEFEPRARLVVLELQNYLRDEYGMVAPADALKSAAAEPDGATTADEPSANGHAKTALESDGMAAPTLIHSAKGPRWRIDVHQPKGVTDPEDFMVFLTGDMGQNVYRSRHMRMGLFRSLAGCLEFARRETPRILAETKVKAVSDFPQSLSQELARSELFYVTIAVCRREDGHIEPTLALYDAEDDTAPVLIAMDQEIDTLCQDCSAVMAAAAAARG